MLALGLILIVLASLVLIAAIAGGANDQAQFYVGSLQANMSTMTVFLLGAATLLIFVFGLEFARSGARRANRRRKETKDLNKRAARAEESAGPQGTADPESPPSHEPEQS